MGQKRGDGMLSMVLSRNRPVISAHPVLAGFPVAASLRQMVRLVRGASSPCSRDLLLGEQEDDG